jgi:hypothetical protein
MLPPQSRPLPPHIILARLLAEFSPCVRAMHIAASYLNALISHSAQRKKLLLLPLAARCSYSKQIFPLFSLSLSLALLSFVTAAAGRKLAIANQYMRVHTTAESAVCCAEEKKAMRFTLIDFAHCEFAVYFRLLHAQYWIVEHTLFLLN